jgi:hypothetical protein
MSAAVVITQLNNLVRDLETWIAGLNDVTCAEDELSALDKVGKAYQEAFAIYLRSMSPTRATILVQLHLI